jgi:hypothetical protein
MAGPASNANTRFGKTGIAFASAAWKYSLEIKMVYRGGCGSALDAESAPLLRR